MWRFIPFYLALIAAPLLFGGVKPESQAILGILLSIGLLLTAKISTPSNGFPKWAGPVALSLLLLQLVPLPLAVVKILSPERVRLATEFPIDGRIPSWVTLTSSVALTVQRYWEIALAVAAFVLARRHATIPGAKQRLAISVSMALVLLATSDIWSAAHGRTSVLGIWNISWGKGYGTFANHNHFANWIYVAALFCIGWVIREVFRQDNERNIIVIAFVSAATLFALAMAFLSASRSGTLAFVFGLSMFGFLMRSHFQRRVFAVVASSVLVGSILIGLLTAEPVLKRFRSGSTGSTMALKTEIWKQALEISTKFPLFGAGPGSFVRVFNYYKTAHGDGTFLHAENDFAELPLEYGFALATLLIAILALAAAKNPGPHSPARAGMIAAVALFLAHATVEFVSFVPANLMLAGVLLAGILPAQTEATSTKPFFLPKLATTVALCLISCVQLFTWHQYQTAFQKPALNGMLNAQRSLTIWPFATQREIGLLRLTSDAIARQPRSIQTQIASRVDTSVSKALEVDPLNSSVRLEQALFELAYTTNRSRALSNAWLTIRLNPLNGQIPLDFARRFATSDPELALQFLSAVHPNISANHYASLDLAWTITHDADQLWKLTPNTTNAILNLVRFAQEKKLYQIAAEGCRALENRVHAEFLAQLYLNAKQPAPALRLVSGLSTLRSQTIQIVALTQLNRPSEAIAIAQTLFANPQLQPLLEKKLPPTDSFSKLLANQKERPTDPIPALLLAEKSASLSPPEVLVLSNLTTQFPSEPRIAFLLFQNQTNNPAAAAKTAANLARFLVDQFQK